MTSEIVGFAYRGEWPELLRHLENESRLVNSLSEKGYTPLHQAAWHGAERWVVGTLLGWGADPAARTHNQGQSPADIALEKHPDREDLHFLLRDAARTPGQLLRKLVADAPDLFDSYDGNQVLCDRVLECLCSGDVQRSGAEIGQTMLTAIEAAAGPAFFQTGSIRIGAFQATSSLWLNTIIPTLVQLSMTARLISLDRSYTVISDLFDPEPFQWGLRGDPFLWMEMRQALCHVPIPEEDETMERILLGCFTSLTGEELSPDKNYRIKRYAFGGMSSGMVCGVTWTEKLLPMLRQRAQWLRDAWQRKG